MAKVLIIDDDPHIRELVRYVVTRAGFAVAEAGDGPAALHLLESETVDCAVLDVMMPKMDGWELCRILKGHYDFPILMLTAKGETAQKVKGLNLGADDYLVKPFDGEELVARLRALLRRSGAAVTRRTQIGTLVLDADTREVIREDERQALPQKEFELLMKLASRPGTTFTRDQLIEGVWGSDFNGNERTLDVHINRLRERLPEESCGVRIVTIRGLGYRLEVSR
ncbi:MAG TPA: response regulator transcription factor [Spirochaetia bacterium]